MTDQLYDSDGALNTREIDHAGKGIGRLALFEDKDRFTGLLTSYLNQIQSIEDLLWDVLVGRLLPTAVGVQLDHLGQIVGQPRLAMTDSDYRLTIQARAKANKSNGTLEWSLDLYQIFTTGTVYARELYDAAVIYGVYSGSLFTEAGSIISSIGRRAKPVGVLSHFSYWGGEESRYAVARSVLTYAEDPDFDGELEDPDQGVGSTLDPTIGGGAASVYATSQTGDAAIVNPFSSAFSSAFGA